MKGGRRRHRVRQFGHEAIFGSRKDQPALDRQRRRLRILPSYRSRVIYTLRGGSITITTKVFRPADVTRILARLSCNCDDLGDGGNQDKHSFHVLSGPADEC